MTHLGDGEAGQGHTGTRTRGLVHLPVHQGGLGALGGVLVDLKIYKPREGERGRGGGGGGSDERVTTHKTEQEAMAG